MPRHRLRVTAAEWIVLAAIAGVMVSAVVPAMQRARQGAGAQPARTAHDRGRQPSAGQSNTIRLPDAAPGSPTREEQARRRRPSGGGVAWLATVAAVTALVFRLLRRSSARQARRRRRRPHESA
jgi:hypothetical protein